MAACNPNGSSNQYSHPMTSSARASSDGATMRRPYLRQVAEEPGPGLSPRSPRRAGAWGFFLALERPARAAGGHRLRRDLTRSDPTSHGDPAHSRSLCSPKSRRGVLCDLGHGLRRSQMSSSSIANSSFVIALSAVRRSSLRQHHGSGPQPAHYRREPSTNCECSNASSIQTTVRPPP